MSIPNSGFALNVSEFPMSKHSTHKILFAVAATLVLAAPAQAGSRHDDCFRDVFRGMDHTMTRVVHHTGRVLKDMFRWCDRRA